MKFLLDTNICIYLINQRSTKIISKLKLISIGEIGISSITVAELMYGVEKSQHPNKNLEALEAFTTPLEIVHFDEDAARYYGKIRKDLEKKGTTIGSLDYLIAAHALSLNVTLVTNNVKEFSRIKDLKIENWV